ncbi:uncharacterized protein LOC108110986 [Drosophila eugracilis]|uniref:uncharacterized protein LOC108110986 n=1 Tax=Drosophila eugracilis TaxID=29029 RepID=UPI0007E7CE7C|nr:uncharacterized protein LOC108110986 [Drosophila eugracilis]
MQFLATLSLIFILAGLTAGQSDVICTLEPLPVGQCNTRRIGFSYSGIRNRCLNTEFYACQVRGNFFPKRSDCESKCKPEVTLRNNPFSYFAERAIEEARKMFARVVPPNLNFLN